MAVRIVKELEEDKTKKNEILKPGTHVQIFNKSKEQERVFEGNAVIVEHVRDNQYLVQFRHNENWQPVEREIEIDTEWKFDTLPEREFHTERSIIVEVMRGNDEGVTFENATYLFEINSWPESGSGKVFKWRYTSISPESGLSPKAEWERWKNIIRFD